MSSEALDLFDHLRGCIGWKRLDKEVNMIWLDGYVKDSPPMLLARRANKPFPFLSYGPD